VSNPLGSFFPIAPSATQPQTQPQLQPEITAPAPSSGFNSNLFDFMNKSLPATTSAPQPQPDKVVQAAEQPQFHWGVGGIKEISNAEPSPAPA